MIAIPSPLAQFTALAEAQMRIFLASMAGRRHSLRAIRNTGPGLPAATLRQIQGAIGKDDK